MEEYPLHLSAFMSGTDQQHREARALCELRRSRGWSQKDFAAHVFGDHGANAHKIVSRLEKGDQTLTDAQRAAVEKSFGVSMPALVSQQFDDQPEPLVLLSNREYFQQHARFVEKVGSRAEVWFFNPVDDMPVLELNEVRDRWVSNLRMGISKHLVWSLPMADEGLLRMYLQLALEVLFKAGQLQQKGNTASIGRITFWALSLGKDALQDAVRESYIVQKEQLGTGASPNLVIEPPIDSAEHVVLREVHALRSIILNRSLDPVSPSYCASYEFDVGSDPWGEVSSGWLFHGLKTRTRLERIAEVLSSRSQPRNRSTKHPNR